MTKDNRRLITLSNRIARDQAEFGQIKETLKIVHGVGEQDNFTVFKVKSTKVSGYRRSGFTALRIKR